MLDFFQYIHQELAMYLYFTRIRIINNFAYSFELLIRLVSNFLTLMITIFIWKAAYMHRSTLAGVDQQQMITYSIISILLVSFYQVRVDSTINMRIREGQIAIDFIRPVNLLISWFFDDLGTSVDAILLNLLPLLVFSILIIKVPLPHDLAAFLLFLVSIVLSYLLIWLITALTAMVAFWYTELGSITVIRFQLIRVLSGSFVPIWFFPAWVQKISAFLPFIYLYQNPLGIYIGKINPRQAFISMVIQLVWIVLFGLVLVYTWKKACRRVIVQGG